MVPEEAAGQTTFFLVTSRPLASTQRIAGVFRALDPALEAMLRIVAVETRFRKVGAEIAKATRRITMRNETILPDLRARMRAVLLSLEEREREDIFRMKRVKGRRGDRK